MFLCSYKATLVSLRNYSLGNLPDENTKSPSVLEVQRKKFQRAWAAFKMKPEYTAHPTVRKMNRKIYIYTALITVFTIGNVLIGFAHEDE